MVDGVEGQAERPERVATEDDGRALLRAHEQIGRHAAQHERADAHRRRAHTPRVHFPSREVARAAPVSAFYGAIGPTGAIDLRLKDGSQHEIEPNIVTLSITEETPPKTVIIVLLDAASGRTLKQIDNVAVSLAIT